MKSPCEGAAQVGYAKDATIQERGTLPVGPYAQRMTSGVISLPATRQKEEIRLINEKSEPIPTHPPTFPARPIRGGKPELAPKKSGIWFAEPKFNGWWALVHTPTGAMWNRHGHRLTIEREFDAALDILRPLAGSGLVWADCEALERRHRIGRGSLVVLDWIPESGSPTYEERREFLCGLVETECLSTGEWQTFPENALFLPPSVRDEGNRVPDFYAGLKAINRRLGCDFFEGVVMICITRSRLGGWTWRRMLCGEAG